MIHRLTEWPPLRDAFAKLDSKTRRETYGMEQAIDTIQAAQDGPTSALEFYNLVCSIEKEPQRRTEPLGDNKPDRKIVSFFIRYHHLLSRKDTTGSNALIGAWQKELGHQNAWEDFNSVYEHGPSLSSRPERKRGRPTRASTRKSTGCIPVQNSVNIPKISSGRKSVEHLFSDSPLTTPPSSDDEGEASPKRPRIPSPSSGGGAISRSITGPSTRDLNDCSFWSINQDISYVYSPREVQMDSADEPPPTPPQESSVFVDPSQFEPENSTDEVTYERADDPMNGTSASAICIQPGTGQTLSVAELNHPRSLSAPLPSSSSVPRKKKRKRVLYYPKKKSSKQKKELVEETTNQPMAIDTPAVADADPELIPSTEPFHRETAPSKPSMPRVEASKSLKISIRSISTPPIVPEIRQPLSASCTNVPSLEPAPGSIVDPLPGELKGFGDASVVPAPVFSRPALPRNPPIWAQSRQELCESCDFFKSYQAGVYYSNGYAKGYLLSCFGAKRDIWQDGGRLIISHGGGKAASKLVEADHQSSRDPSVNALVQNWKTKEPLVLVADDKYQHFPFDLTRGADGGRGYAYVVLGYYFVRHYWTERHPADNGEGYAIRFKFAFQYCGEGDPWWITYPGFPLETLSPPGTEGFQNLCETTCFTCRKTSPQVYEQGWMCLWPVCELYFQLHGVDATTTQLTYTKVFLAARPNPKARKPAVRIPEPVIVAKNGIVTTPLFYHGWHCRRCGRLSCRTKWEQWECSSCGFILPVVGRVRGHKEFWGIPTNVPYENCDVNPASGITKIVSVRNQLGTFTFILPHNRGKIHLISGSVRYNTEANEIFKEYQVHANNGSLPFRRFPMKAHICRGDFLTNYFSQNSGEPYQYVGAADKTLPFDQCPPCVHRALELIRTRVTMMIGERPPFNELLTAAYMEKQSMGFHTDGERGLGPIVASLSMGSPALMKFRTLEDKKTIVLTLVLRHGDVVVMEGATIQAVYEHTVCPVGFRIAVTAREIRPENSAQGAWR